MQNLILSELKRLRQLYPETKHSFKVCFDLDGNFGGYQYKTNILYFNLNVANTVGFNLFREVVAHEFSHYINYIKDNNLLHNKLWKDEMLFCGVLNARSTIDFNNLLVNKNLIKVVCQCSTYKITKNRLTRLKNGRKYRCPSCSGEIREV